MISSSAITAQCLAMPNPAEAEELIWQNARYLIAQRLATPDFQVTDEQHYRGYKVLPAPKADPELCPRLGELNLQVLKNVHGIRFTDNHTTAGADYDIVMANYGIMTDDEADDYERFLRKNSAKTS